MSWTFHSESGRHYYLYATRESHSGLKLLLEDIERAPLTFGRAFRIDSEAGAEERALAQAVASYPSGQLYKAARALKASRLIAMYLVFDHAIARTGHTMALILVLLDPPGAP